MADRSKIEWTDASWNPIRARDRATGRIGWHCEHASPGCANCYSEGFNARLGTQLPFKPGHRTDIEIVLDPKMLLQPLRWVRPRMIFVCSMTDLFADFLPDEIIDQVFAVMALCPQHTFQVLTKRSARMRAYLSAARANPVGMAAFSIVLGETARKPKSNVGAGVMLKGDIPHLAAWPLPNVWLGVSAEDQRRAEERLPDLAMTPAAVHFASIEPMLDHIDLTKLHTFGHGLLNALRGSWAVFPITTINGRAAVVTQQPAALDCVIVGGESGRKARPMHPDWARSLRDQCAAAGVPFFFKQWGEWSYRHPDWPRAVPTVMANDGTTYAAADLAYPDGARYGEALRAGHNKAHLTNIYRVGKKAAGRLLDGVEHNGMPDRAPALAGAA